MPRLKNPKTDKRSRKILVALTPAEYAEVVAQAGKVNLPMAVYCRSRICGQKIVHIPELNREAYAALSKVANNLNQIARYLNSVEADPNLLQFHEQQLTELQRLRLQLLSSAEDRT